MEKAKSAPNSVPALAIKMNNIPTAVSAPGNDAAPQNVTVSV